jgi:hypothetical protein
MGEGLGILLDACPAVSCGRKLGAGGSWHGRNEATDVANRFAWLAGRISGAWSNAKMATKAFAVLILCSLAQSSLMRHNTTDKSVGIELLSFGLSVLRLFFLAIDRGRGPPLRPLGEITETYFPDPASPRFRNFFLFGVLLEAILLPVELSNGLLGFLLFCLAAFFGARLIVLFPATAIDGPGANLAGAWQNSSGHFWPIVATIVLSILPGLLVFVLRTLFPEPGYALLIGLAPFGAVIATFVARRWRRIFIAGWCNGRISRRSHSRVGL